MYEIEVEVEVEEEEEELVAGPSVAGLRPQHLTLAAGSPVFLNSTLSCIEYRRALSGYLQLL
jgi:hypothetical protein